MGSVIEEEVKMSQRKESAVVACPWILHAARTSVHSPSPSAASCGSHAVAIMPYWVYRLCEKDRGKGLWGWFARRQNLGPKQNKGIRPREVRKLDTRDCRDTANSSLCQKPLFTLTTGNQADFGKEVRAQC